MLLFKFYTGKVEKGGGERMRGRERNRMNLSSNGLLLKWSNSGGRDSTQVPHE